MPSSGNATWMRYASRLRMLATVSLVLVAAPYTVYLGEKYAPVRPSASLFSSGTAFQMIFMLSGMGALLVGAVPWVLTILGTLRGRRWWSVTILVVTGAFIWLNWGVLEAESTGKVVISAFTLIGDYCQFFSIALFTATFTYALWAGPLEPRGGGLQ